MVVSEHDQVLDGRPPYPKWLGEVSSHATKIFPVLEQANRPNRRNAMFVGGEMVVPQSFQAQA